MNFDHSLKRNVFKTGATSLGVLYFLTQCLLAHAVETNVWKERKAKLVTQQNSLSQSPQLAALVSPSIPSRFESFIQEIPKPQSSIHLKVQQPDIAPVWKSELGKSQILLSIPPAVGQVRRVLQPKGIKTDKTVLFIQDVHLNEEAQRNIGLVLEPLIEKEQLDVVGLEGAFESLRLNQFQRAYPLRVRQTLVEYLARDQKISGPVASALLGTFQLPPIEGVDDRALYLADVNAYREAALLGPKLQTILGRLEKENIRLKGEIFGDQLRAFDNNVQGYRNGTLSLVDHVRILEHDLDSFYPQLSLFSKAAELEKQMNFDQVQKERDQIIHSLVSRLSPEEVSQLMDGSMAYKAGQLKDADFYAFLTQLCASHRVLLKKYRNMDSFIQYLLLTERIDSNNLFEELQLAENETFGRLVSSPQERTLVEEANVLFLTKKLISFSLSSLEWQQYKVRKSFISPSFSLFSELKPFEKFYETAEKRDQAMVSNLAHLMEKKNAKVAGFVAGGFHTNGVVTGLNNLGISVVVVTPRITKVNPDDTDSSLAVFSQEKTPLDKLFQGEKLFLAPAPSVPFGQLAVFATGIGEQQRPGEGVASFLALGPRLVPQLSVVKRSTTQLVLQLKNIFFQFDFSQGGSLQQVQLRSQWWDRFFGFVSSPSLRRFLVIFSLLLFLFPAHAQQSPLLTPPPPATPIFSPTSIEGQATPEMIRGVDGDQGIGIYTRSAGNVVVSEKISSSWLNPFVDIPVKKGDVIATISNPAIDDRIASLKADQEPLSRKLDALKKLYAQSPDAVSLSELLSLMSQVARYDADIRPLEYQREVMDVLVAPQDGFILKGTRRAGTIESGGSIGRFIPSQYFQIQVRVPLRDFRPYFSVKINGKAAVITNLALNLDPNTRSVIARINLMVDTPRSEFFQKVGYHVDMTPAPSTVGNIPVTETGVVFALVGERERISLPPPEFPGKLNFDVQEASRLGPDERIAGVNAAPFFEGLFLQLDDLTKIGKGLDKARDEILVPAQAATPFELPIQGLGERIRPVLDLKNRAGKADAMFSPREGIIVGILNFDGQSVQQQSPQLHVATLLTANVNIPEILIKKDVSVNVGDVVKVYSSWGFSYGTVKNVKEEILSKDINATDFKSVDVEIVDPQFLFHPGLPVKVVFVSPADQEKTRAMMQKPEIPQNRNLYPISFSNPDVPLELAMAFWSGTAGNSTGLSEESLQKQLLTQILEGTNPVNRISAFNQYLTLRPQSDYSDLVRIATQGSPDVATSAILHLSEQSRVLELLEVITTMNIESASWTGDAGLARMDVYRVAYRLVLSLLERSQPTNDAYTQLVQQSRSSPALREKIEPLLMGILMTEGIDSPVGTRILRGEGDVFFWTDDELRAMEAGLRMADQKSHADSFYVERLRRRLVDEGQVQYGYGANYLTGGILFIKNLGLIDQKVAVEENNVSDLRGIKVSPKWDPVTVNRTLINAARSRTLPLNIGPDASSQQSFPSFRSVSDSGQRLSSTGIMTFSQKANYVQRVVLSGRPEIMRVLLEDDELRDLFAPTIIDGLLSSPEGRLELARFVLTQKYSGFIPIVNQSDFKSRILADIYTQIRLNESLLDSSNKESRADPSIKGLQEISRLKIYQSILLYFRQNAVSSQEGHDLLVAWMGLLPNSFELQQANRSLRFSALTEQGIKNSDIDPAAATVVERRAIQFAIRRERDKRKEVADVVVSPGPVEPLFRGVLESMDPQNSSTISPLKRFQFSVVDLLRSKRETLTKADQAILEDVLSLAKNRATDILQGTRVQVNLSDLVLNLMRGLIVPLLFLFAIPVVWWILRGIYGLITIYFSKPVPRQRDLDAMSADILLRAQNIEDDNIKDLIQAGLKSVKSKDRTLQSYAEAQVSIRKLINKKGLFFSVGGREVDREGGSSPDFIDPSRSKELTFITGLLVDLCQFIALQLSHDMRDNKKWSGAENLKGYYLLKWFGERTTYFSWLRYLLDPLMHLNTANSYNWVNIQKWPGTAGLATPLVIGLNFIVSIINFIGRWIIAFPVRIIYLFSPAVWIARLYLFVDNFLLPSGLPRLRRIGNRVEPHLYPKKDRLGFRTDSELQEMGVDPTEFEETPGTGSTLVRSKMVTRFIPILVFFLAIASSVNFGGLLVPVGINIRGTGFWAAFGSLAMLGIAIFWHWVRVVHHNWLPFGHIKNVLSNKRLLRLLRKSVPDQFQERLNQGPSAEEELQTLYFQEKNIILQREIQAEDPSLHIVVAMVQNPTVIHDYEKRIRPLLNPKTVLVMVDTSGSLEGGDARLDTEELLLKKYGDIRANHPYLPQTFSETRSAFLLIGQETELNTFLPIPVRIPSIGNSESGETISLTPLILAIMNAHAYVRENFIFNEGRDSEVKMVGNITLDPSRMFMGPARLTGAKEEEGVGLISANQSIEAATEESSLVVFDKKAFVRTTIDTLTELVKDNQNQNDIHPLVDLNNTQKRQLPTAHIVMTKFKDPSRYKTHIGMQSDYNAKIDEIRRSVVQRVRNGELTASPSRLSVHYMRHIIVPWFIADRHGNLETYRSAVLTSGLEPKDAARVFNTEVVDLVDEYRRGLNLPRVYQFNPAGARATNIAKRPKGEGSFGKLIEELFPSLLIDPNIQGKKYYGIDPNTTNTNVVYLQNQPEITSDQIGKIYNFKEIPDPFIQDVNFLELEFPSGLNPVNKVIEITLPGLPDGHVVDIVFFNEAGDRVHEIQDIAAIEMRRQKHLAIFAGASKIELYLRKRGTKERVAFKIEKSGTARFIDLTAGLDIIASLEAVLEKNRIGENKSIRVEVEANKGNFLVISLLKKDGHSTEVLGMTQPIPVRIDNKGYPVRYIEGATHIHVEYQDRNGNKLEFTSKGKIVYGNDRRFYPFGSMPIQEEKPTETPVSYEGNQVEASVHFDQGPRTNVLSLTLEKLKLTSYVKVRIQAPQGLYATVIVRNKNYEIIRISDRFAIPSYKQGFSFQIPKGAHKLSVQLTDLRGRPVRFPQGEGVVTFSDKVQPNLPLRLPGRLTSIKEKVQEPPQQNAKRGFGWVYMPDLNKFTMSRDLPLSLKAYNPHAPRSIYFGEWSHSSKTKWFQALEKTSEENITLALPKGGDRKAVKFGRSLVKERMFKAQITITGPPDQVFEARFIFVKKTDAGYEFAPTDFQAVTSLNSVQIPQNTIAVLVDAKSTNLENSVVINDVKLTPSKPRNGGRKPDRGGLWPWLQPLYQYVYNRTGSVTLSDAVAPTLFESIIGEVGAYYLISNLVQLESGFSSLMIIIGILIAWHLLHFDPQQSFTSEKLAISFSSVILALIATAVPFQPESGLVHFALLLAIFGVPHFIVNFFFANNRTENKFATSFVDLLENPQRSGLENTDRMARAINLILKDIPLNKRIVSIDGRPQPLTTLESISRYLQDSEAASEAVRLEMERRGFIRTQQEIMSTLLALVVPSSNVPGRNLGSNLGTNSLTLTLIPEGLSEDQLIVLVNSALPDRSQPIEEGSRRGERLIITESESLARRIQEKVGNNGKVISAPTLFKNAEVSAADLEAVASETLTSELNHFSSLRIILSDGLVLQGINDVPSFRQAELIVINKALQTMMLTVPQLEMLTRLAQQLAMQA